MKWCNDAGGINGRKIELTNYDAKLFNVAQQMIQACQTEFMLVGNGNGLDEPGATPRSIASSVRSRPTLSRRRRQPRAFRSSRRPTPLTSSRWAPSGCSG